MGLRSDIKSEVLRLGQHTVARLLADDRRAAQIASALGSLQRGKQALDRGQERLMHQLSLVSKGDYKALGKRLATLKRRARAIETKLDAVQRPDPASKTD